MRYHFRLILACISLTVTAACTQTGPGVGQIDRYLVHTPVFADNRIFFVGPENTSHVSALTLQGTALKRGDKTINHGDPLSIIVNSVEMPQQWPKELSTGQNGTIDVAVIIDLATASDGSWNSYAVWYQRGVTAGQSLNFSNLLVHAEPRWDQRVAPMFRIRVMNVVKERNAETLANLDQVQQKAGAIMQMITVPVVSQALNIASQAARLVIAGQANQNLLDYTVQFYGTDAISQSGGAGLGALRKGEFVTVGKPQTVKGRDFWTQKFSFDKRSRVVKSNGAKTVPAPLARMTVGTFESIVPKIVIERSDALVKHLSQQSAKLSLDQLKKRSDDLQNSIDAFTMGENIIRYGQLSLGEACRTVKKYMDAKYSPEDKFFLTRAFNRHFKPKDMLRSLEEVKAHLNKIKKSSDPSC